MSARKNATRLLLVSLLAASTAAIAAPEAFDLDPTHTYPSFEINHLGFSVMRGSFYGTTGTVTIDTAAKTASVSAVIDAKSISTGYDKRDDHLRSPDFLDVATYPQMTFKASNFAFDGKTPSEVSGSLTLHGVTKPVTLSVTPTRCDMRATDKNYVCGAIIKTTIKRSDFGVKAYVPYISDEMSIQIEAEAIKHKAM